MSGGYIAASGHNSPILAGEKIFLITGEFTTVAGVIVPYPVKLECAANEINAIPIVIKPDAVRGRLVNSRRTAYTYELLTWLPNLMDPFNTLRFGLKFPDEQRLQRIGTVWRDATGGFWYIGLGITDGQPSVCVRPSSPYDQWHSSLAFLVCEEQEARI